MMRERLRRPVVHEGSSRDPRTRPDAPDGLMVFDGLCNFCSANVRLVLRADRAGAIRFTSIQSPYGRHLARRFSIDVDDPSTFLFFDEGRPLEASDAAVALARRLPPPWRWLAILTLVPRPVRDALYHLVARHRYRIAGRRSTCMIPSPEHRGRFVDEMPSAEAPASGQPAGPSTVKRPE